MSPAVFITARFRSGSTVLWNMFRQIPEVVAYYEPLHEKLPQWIVSGKPPQPSHYHVNTYFREYPPVEELKQYHMAEFGICRLYLEVDARYPRLKQYIEYLIDFTRVGQIPVIQFNRVDFRLAWLKMNFPDIPIIHLYRSPRDQWLSSINQYPQSTEEDNIDTDTYLITTWARDLCPKFPFLAGPFIRHPYQRHYYLWKLSYLAGRHFADISISYEELLTSPENTSNALLQAVGLNTQKNLEQCLAVIVQKPFDIWKQYRDEEWFTTLEQECETTLSDLGLNQHFGKTPLSEIITENKYYQNLIADQNVYIWAIRNGQLTAMEQEVISEEKEQVIQELHSIIEHLKLHPLRPFLKRYLPNFLVNGFRQARSWFQPRLGQFQQYPPIPLNIPEHYYETSALSQQSLPVVSIITPTLNQAQFLERTITSVIGQSYPNLEYIIQDGASSDGTAQILEKYRSQLKHVESCQDKGQAHAINLGFRHVRGDIMAWLNSDDLLLPGTVTYIVKFFLDHPEVEVVYGHRIVINEDGAEVGRWILPPHDDNVLLWADYIPQETIFWRRRIWEKAGGYLDESYHFALDWELLLRFREAGATFTRLPRFLAAFRVHEHQKTSKELEGRGSQEMQRLRERCHGRHVSHEEAHYNIRHYMRKHVFYDYLHRLRILQF